MGRGRNAEVIRGVGGIVRVGTESERKILVRATTHAERAKSVRFLFKIDSSKAE